jgi:hypothetical protein
MTKLCVGLLSYCDSKAYPKRFEIFKKCLEGLKLIADEDVYIYALDNGSSEDVFNLLKNSPHISAVYKSRENLFDVLAVNLLVRKAKEIGAKYVMHLEDDLLFYDNRNFLESCIDILEKNKDCGYVRILKYDFNNKEMYDKFSNHPKKDTGNYQRHYNNITKAPLVWSNAVTWGNFNFYMTNWHWYNYPNICRLDVLEKIIPKDDCYQMMHLEGEMMKKYNDLQLFTCVMDLGVVSHITGKDTSIRILQKACLKKEFPLIAIEKINKEIEYFLGKENSLRIFFGKIA